MKSYRSLGGLLLASTMLFAPHAVAQDGAESSASADSGIALSIQPTYTDEIVVRGRNIPNPQRATSQVATFLGEDDLARTGDAEPLREAVRRVEAALGAQHPQMAMYAALL